MATAILLANRKFLSAIRL